MTRKSDVTVLATICHLRCKGVLLRRIDTLLRLHGLNNEHWITIGVVWCICCDVKCSPGFFKASSILKVAIDQLKVLSIVHLKPHTDCFAWKAAIRLADDHFTTWLQDSTNFFEHLDWFN